MFTSPGKSTIWYWSLQNIWSNSDKYTKPEHLNDIIFSIIFIRSFCLCVFVSLLTYLHLSLGSFPLFVPLKACCLYFTLWTEVQRGIRSCNCFTNQEVCRIFKESCKYCGVVILTDRDNMFFAVDIIHYIELSFEAGAFQTCELQLRFLTVVNSLKWVTLLFC